MILVAEMNGEIIQRNSTKNIDFGYPEIVQIFNGFNQRFRVTASDPYKNAQCVFKACVL